MNKLSLEKITKIKNKVSWINFSHGSNKLKHEYLLKKNFKLLHTYQGMVLDLKNWNIKDSLDNDHIKVVETKSDVETFSQILLKVVLNEKQ
ncbi:hypothetical protein CK556_02565 [Mesoplasma chauliocola]|uniref:Uncharacterized protein n=1 Tax=Mesoplasma chauliocola TaxID=216427 RepID=A0A249SNI1_9MOLU|nr:hypothetical protein [Mesoplasma chauliocola]ASZ09224.1 hypothetical protein CK556_02565 [Mesoplasma chauliocola]